MNEVKIKEACWGLSTSPVSSHQPPMTLLPTSAVENNTSLGGDVVGAQQPDRHPFQNTRRRLPPILEFLINSV